MRKILFIAVTFFCSLIITAQDLSKIDNSLQQEMAFKAKTDIIRINILLEAQYDQIELKNKANVFKNNEAKRNFVVNELKQFSKETQKNLLTLLSNLSENTFGEDMVVNSIQSLWISNSINCYASVSVIEMLSEHPDILLLGLDDKLYLLPEDEKPTPAEPTREITYNVTLVEADQVWDLGYTGDGVIVGVVDSGVNYNHTDLQGNMWEHPDYPYHGYNYIGNNNNPIDDNGHGTHCAGTVAGHGASGSQTGIAPSAKIMAVKVLDHEGYGSLFTITSGIEFAVENGAHIISLSLGFSGGGDETGKIQMRNTMNNVLEAGIIAAVAAGNEGSGLGPMMYPIPNNVRLPANCPSPWLHPHQTIKGGLSSVVCVGATNSSDYIAPFSSKGPVTWYAIPGFNDYPYNPGIGLIRPDVVAPGVNVKSLQHNNNSGYTFMDGTSMATPCVAGIMALMLSKNPNLTPADICEMLQTTALPLSPTKNNIYGAGRVNALDAVNVGIPIHIYFESLVINDENNSGRLKPGEQVTFTISLQNEKEREVENVFVTLVTTNELVTIDQATADFGNFSDFEIKTVQDAFTITLSPDALANQVITFTLLISSDESFCESTFTTTVYNYLFEILDVVIPGDEPLSAGDTSDVWFYLTNSGNEDASEITGKITSNSYFLTINEDEQFYGNINRNQYKYRPFNITISPSTPSSLTRFNVNFLVTDELGKTTEISSQININNSDNPPQICGEIISFTAELDESNLSDIILTWDEPEESTPEKYFIYCNNMFLTETTSTTYTHEDVVPGIYNYCIEALYEEGCTSGINCIVFEFTGSIDKIQNQLFIYPNPFKNEIFISNEYSVVSVEILNAMGQKAIEVKYDCKPINTSNLSSGIYFVVIETLSGKKLVYKMVK